MVEVPGPEGQMSGIKPEKAKKNIAFDMIARGEHVAQKKFALRREGEKAMEGIAMGAEIMKFARFAQLCFETGNERLAGVAGRIKQIIETLVSNLDDTNKPPSEEEKYGEIYSALSQMRLMRDTAINEALSLRESELLEEMDEKASRMPSFDAEDLPAKKDSEEPAE
ncbi:hypothetical protein KJ673_00985 [Patescibacteria group bacterium]|nr:hypothetical protein [Patescibacteria group bacterium]MCG2687534.1 hypothetical protein [Candidatus Parcubacteria bacterium]